MFCKKIFPANLTVKLLTKLYNIRMNNNKRRFAIKEPALFVY